MDLEATPAEKRQLEYATQHFDFTPDSLTDTITMFALENLEVVLKKMMTHCTKEFAKKVPEHEMKESFALLQEKYGSATEKNLEDFSSYIQKHLLTVPQHVVLPDDREQLHKKLSTDGNEGLSNDAGTKMTEDLKRFDLACQNSRALRYKLAVIEAKNSNLKRVKEAQKSLRQQAVCLNACEQLIDSAIKEENRKLDQKMEKLGRIMDEIESKHNASNNENNVVNKRVLDEMDRVSAKRIKLDFKTKGTDSGIENEISFANNSTFATTVNSSAVSIVPVEKAKENNA